MHAAQRHPHHARRHDQPRRGGGARHGPRLRRRRRRSARRLRRQQTIAAREHVVKAGEIITIDGSTGEVMLGEVPTMQPELSGDFATLMGWADEVRTHGRARQCRHADRRAHRARASAPRASASAAPSTCSSTPTRIIAVREMIMADDVEGREARARQAPADAARRFRRALPHHGGPAGDDPPARSAAARIPAQDRCRDGGGRQGDRQGPRDHPPPRAARCTRPTRCSAIAAAGSPSPRRRSTRCRRAPSSRRRPTVAKETGASVEPEIMIPLVATKKEFDILKAMIDRVGRRGHAARPASQFNYMVGTMIELPRAALARRRDRRDRRVLQLRHQRSDADLLRPVARRRRQFPRRLSEAGHHRARSLRHHRPRRRRRADEDRRRARPRDARAS